MAMRKYISNIEASYFETHQLFCLEAPPSEGEFNIGDIVISNTQEDSSFGWVCVEAGEPGIWRKIINLSNIQEAIKELQEKENSYDGSINDLNQRIDTVYTNLTLKDEEYSNRIDELNLYIQNNDNVMGNLNNNIESNRDAIESLTELIHNLDGSTGEIENELRDLIINLNNKVNVNIDNITTNKRDIEVLNNKLDTEIVELISDVDEKVNDNINNISINKNDIYDLKNRLDNFEGGNESNLSELQNNVNELDNKIETNVLDISNIKSELIEMGSNISTNTTTIEDIKNEVGAYDENINNLIETTSRNTDSINLNNEAINNIQNRLDDLENIDLSIYQTEESEELKTESKNIVGAINEIYNLIIELRATIENNNTEEDPEIYCTSINVLNDTIEVQQSEEVNRYEIEYEVQPTNTTEEVVWSISPVQPEQESGITISNGNIEVPPIGNVINEMIVTVTCGNYSDTCLIVINNNE